MKLLLVTTILALALTSAPIPTRPEGFQYNVAAQKKVQLDVFEDLLCIDCKENIPHLMDFMESHAADGTPIKDLVELTFHMFPLPYHHHAYIVTQAAYFTQEISGDMDKVHDYITWAFDHQSEFQGTDSKQLTEPQVIDKICKEGGENSQFGWNESDCQTAFLKHKGDMDLRVAFKFASYNSVTGTPTVHVNGVEAPQFPESVAAWNSLLSGSLQSHVAVQASI